MIKATRASAGIAGKGMPLVSIRLDSIILVRSRPVTVRVDWPGVPPGFTCIMVVTPSIITFGVPLTVRTRITRNSGV